MAPPPLATDQHVLLDSAGLAAETTHDPRALAFVRLRQQGQACTTYPGHMPTEMSEAYAIQEVALTLWPDRVAGWKVGRIADSFVARHGTDRLIGPIFARQVKRLSDRAAEPTSVPVLAQGFAAVEAELVFELAADAPPERKAWRHEAALALIGGIYAGIEIASSPFLGINDCGPAVTASDFGNNFGLVLAAPLNVASLPGLANTIPIPGLFDVQAETRINGVAVGVGRAAGLPGGPVQSLVAALEIAASRGRPLTKGCLISTGAITGVHRVNVGDKVEVLFEDGQQIRLNIVAATPAAT